LKALLRLRQLLQPVTIVRRVRKHEQRPLHSQQL
jgi:hypothetical protein